MKRSLFAGLLLALVGDSSMLASEGGKPDSETVLVTYHVKPGREAELQTALSRVWRIYREGHLVFARPHIIVRDTEDGNKPRFIEIFTWIDRDTPEHAPNAVSAIWAQEQPLCEARNGERGIEIGEVQLVTGS